MALTVDEIAEIINTMREENEANVQGVERVLTGINNKLDMMADDNEATDLIRVYISELKKSVDEKHSITVEKFNEIENSFNNLSLENDKLAKTSELRDLFNSLGANISNFANNIASQKNTLDELDGKLSQINENIYNKDEMASLISEISLDISGVSSDLDNSFKNIEDKLSEAVSVIGSLDNSSQLGDIKREITNISGSISALPSSISRYQEIFESLRELISQISSQTSAELNGKFESLENSFQNIVTDADFKGFKGDLADFVQKIIDNSSALNSELSYSTERIENILTTVKSLDFRDDFEDIVNRVNDLKETFEGEAKQNYSNLSAEIAGMAQNLNKSFENLDEKRQGVYSSLKNGLDDVLSSLSVVIENNSQEKLDEISRSIINISNDVMTLRSGISSDFQDDYGDLKAGLGNVIASLESLKSEIISSNQTLSGFSSQNIELLDNRISDQIRELAEVKSLISDSGRIDPEQIAGSINKVSEDISNLVFEAKENANSNYEAVKAYIEEVSQTVNSLQSDFAATAEQNADKIISGITDVASSVEAFRDEFKQSAMSDVENSSKILDSVENVSSKIDSVEQTLSGSARINFESLKSLLEELSQKFTEDMQKQQDVFVQSNVVGEQEKLETLKKMSDDIKLIESTVSSDIETFKYTVQEIITGIKDYIGEISGSISSAQVDSEVKLSSKLESIEVLSHAFETSIASVYDEVKNVTDKISALDVSEQSSEIKLQLSNIVSTSNFILSSINDINSKNSELESLFSNLQEIAVSKDDLNKVFDKLEILEKQDYSYDLTQLSAKIDDLSLLFENSSNNNYTGLCEKIDLINDNIKQNDTSEIVLQKIDGFSDIILSLKNIVENSSDENKTNISQQLVKFEDMFSKVVTGEDFSVFRKDFAEFIQKILDNSNVLHMNSDTNREQITSILERINSFDLSSDFENIAGRIDEIKTSFENNSKMNYENIVNEINNLKIQLDASINSQNSLNTEQLEKFNSELSDLTSNIEQLKELSSKNSLDSLERISDELHIVMDEVEQKLENNIKLNSEDLKFTFNDIISELNLIKDDIAKKNDTNTFNITLGFDSVKSSLENILSAFTELNNDLKNSQAENSQNLFADIRNISAGVDELKSEVQHISESYLDRVYDSVNVVSDKIDALSEGFSADIVNNLSSLKDMFAKLSNDLKVVHEESVQQIKDDSDLQIAEIKTISLNLDSFRTQVNDAIESLKLYISELEANANSSKSEIDNRLAEKLLDLEAALSHVSDEYEEKMETLQGKLSEFVQIVENSTSDTEAKIASSLEEVTDVKNELSLLSSSLKSVKIAADEKFSESMSVIDAGIENIINTLKTVDSSLVENVEHVLKDLLLPLDEKFTNFLNLIDDLKTADNSADSSLLISSLEEKLLGLKQEIGLVNTDISDAIQTKSEEILRAFEPIKTSMEEFHGISFDKLLNEIKSQLETSFLNLSVDVNGELVSSAESVSRLEQAYKETYNKVSVIEETVCDKIQNDIELLNAALEKNNSVIAHAFGEKFEEYLEDLKAHIDLISNSSNNQAIDEISTKLDKIDNIEVSLKEQVSSIKSLHNKVDVLGTAGVNEEIINNIKDADEKAQKHSNIIISDIKGVNDKLSGFIQTESKVSEMLSALHEKVDVIAMGSSEFDILEEVDEIKDLIFEQRKYFEASSDEKTAAIDKYLRDLLLKLDNLDFEKNFEDVKDTIMNALVSLFDQISFVEETEEIKDFVEEKTDEIKENLIKVQTQLHQIASSGDDFEYSYTLQDVESDIAKLRLVMNQISADADFEGLSEGIKKIVTSVEGLESTLTQDQIVDLKGDIEKLNDDILSISSRTNKLLLTSDESYKILNDGLNNFSSLVYRLEDRISELDNRKLEERLEKKLDDIHSMAVASANADKVFHQVMMYLGEWIDSTTENISSITDKTSEILNIKEHIDELRNLIPEKSELLDELQSRFEKQEERIDELEMKLDKILSALAEKDDMVLNRKVDKIEKMLSRLGSNIEKLTSYVDEE